MSNPVERELGMPLIDIRGVVKRFNVGTEAELTVIPGCDFQVYPGEFVAVVGASGSGKSTLMNIIGLLDRPTEGSYLFDGVDMLDTDDDQLAHYRSQNIGFIFQNFNLIGRISALRNVEVPMLYAGLSARERSERAAELLEMVDMGDRMNHLPNELSGGQKQRVAIARALANDPDLLLADEPTGALDSNTGRLVMDMFHKLNQEQKKTIVFITHNPELAAETSRTVIMTDGRLAEAEVKQ
ncbi:Macrolide export ATP-binding/permease protein MacB [Corynebacterium canis]|nr:Macrolide export ATP-binding/permease protein MacB [Corynebacterium canis]